MDRFAYLVTSDGYGTSLKEVQAITFGSPSTHTWYFVCGGYDGANAWISVNAGARDTVPFTADIFDSTNALRVGSGYNAEYVDGLVDELVLYKRALTTSEVGWLYNAGAGRIYAELSPLSSGALSYIYGDAAHAHAVTHINGIQKYWYDANGNQIKRILGTDTYDLTYDAENRLTQVKKNNTVIASFIYDGDARRVQSTVDGTTTTFVGGHYEVTRSEVTKYYFAGFQRVVMRKGGMLSYLLSDHLGSTSITTDASGAVVSELRYKPWGEVRYPASGQNPGPSDYTYTGQYSNMSDFGLMFYNARWYDLVQPDGIELLQVTQTPFDEYAPQWRVIVR